MYLWHLQERNSCQKLLLLLNKIATREGESSTRPVERHQKLAYTEVGQKIIEPKLGLFACAMHDVIKIYLFSLPKCCSLLKDWEKVTTLPLKKSEWKALPWKEWNPLHEDACSEVKVVAKIKLWRKINVFLIQKTAVPTNISSRKKCPYIHLHCLELKWTVNRVTPLWTAAYLNIIRHL